MNIIFQDPFPGNFWKSATGQELHHIIYLFVRSAGLQEIVSLLCSVLYIMPAPRGHCNNNIRLHKSTYIASTRKIMWNKFAQEQIQGHRRWRASNTTGRFMRIRRPTFPSYCAHNIVLYGTLNYWRFRIRENTILSLLSVGVVLRKTKTQIARYSALFRRFSVHIVSHCAPIYISDYNNIMVYYCAYI